MEIYIFEIVELVKYLLPKSKYLQFDVGQVENILNETFLFLSDKEIDFNDIEIDKTLKKYHRLEVEKMLESLPDRTFDFATSEIRRAIYEAMSSLARREQAKIYVSKLNLSEIRAFMHNMRRLLR